MPVEPRYRCGNTCEDDPVGHELVNLVNVEPVVCRPVKAAEPRCKSVGNLPVLPEIHPGGNSDTCNRNTEADRSHAPVDMDMVGLSVAAHKLPERYPTCKQRHYGEEYQRYRHGLRSLVRGMLCMEFPVLLAPEYIIVETEHIESRQSCNECHHRTHHRTETETCRQDLVLGEESAQRPDTGNRKACHQECDMGHRHVFPQSSHGRHLVRMHCMYDTACTEEKQGLEHRMGEEVEHGSHISESSGMRV